METVGAFVPEGLLLQFLGPYKYKDVAYASPVADTQSLRIDGGPTPRISTLQNGASSSQ
jgi:hypothetical protein